MGLTNDQWDEIKRHMEVKLELGLSVLEDEVGVDGPWRWSLHFLDFPPRLELAFELDVDADARRAETHAVYGEGHGSRSFARYLSDGEAVSMGTQAASLARKLGLRIFRRRDLGAEGQLIYHLKPDYRAFEAGLSGSRQVDVSFVSSEDIARMV